MSSPIRIACENSEWAMPECIAGFVVDNAASIFLARLVVNGEIDLSLGLYLAITGARIKGKDLAIWGIATHFVRN